MDYLLQLAASPTAWIALATLIENQRAQQWPGTARLVAALAGVHDSSDSGETARLKLGQ